MLAQPRHSSFGAVGHGAHFHRVARRDHWLGYTIGARHGHKHVARSHVWVVDHLLRTEARTGGNASSCQRLAGFDVGHVCRPFAHASANDLDVFAPSGTSGEAHIGDPIGVAHKVGETFELVLAAHLDDEPTVATGESVEHHLQALAGLRALAHAPVVHHYVGERNHCVEHRDVYVLADAGVVAMTQRSEHADDPKQCGADVAERAHGAHRWGLTGLTFPFVESAHCFGHTCVGGPAVVWGLDGVAEAANRQVDGGRVNGADVVVAKSHAGQGSALEVFGDDIEAGSQRQDQVAARRVLEVDTDRLLREVVAQEGGANIATLRVFHCRQRAAA